MTTDAPSPASAARTTRLILGICVVAILSAVALLSRPSAGLASQQPGGAARLPGPAAHTPQFTLDTPSTRFVDAHLLAGHTGIPIPPAHDPEGRPSLGVLVGPALFVWVYGGNDAVRYTVVDLRGQVLAHSLTANQVYGAFPEINIPEMHFGPDGRLCEPVMMVVDQDAW
jgi:hypothetical protein